MDSAVFVESVPVLKRMIIIFLNIYKLHSVTLYSNVDLNLTSEQLDHQWTSFSVAV